MSKPFQAGDPAIIIGPCRDPFFPNVGREVTLVMRLDAGDVVKYQGTLVGASAIAWIIEAADLVRIFSQIDRFNVSVRGYELGPWSVVEESNLMPLRGDDEPEAAVEERQREQVIS